MFLILKRYFCVISFIIALLSIIQVNTVCAQQKFPNECDMLLWHSNTFFSRGYYIYHFILHTNSIKLSQDEKIEEFVISTDFGDINFEDEINGHEYTRDVTGILFSEEEIKNLIIVRAIGRIGMQRFIFTDNIQVTQIDRLNLKKLK